MSTPAPVILTIPQNGDNQSNKDRISKLFPKRTILILSFTQLICAALAAILQLKLIDTDYSGSGRRSWKIRRMEDISEIGTGIWTGVIFGVSSLLGLLVAHKPSHCKIIGFMILCIISSLMTVPLIVISGIGFGYSTDNNSYDYDYNRDNHYYSSSVCFALQMLVAMLQAVVAIVASAFSCRVVCGRKSQNTGTVIYYGQTFQPQGMYNTQMMASPMPQPQMIQPPSYSGPTVQPEMPNNSQMMSDPVYQPQVFTDPGFTNPQLNQSSGQELASAEENREMPQTNGNPSSEAKGWVGFDD